jgi:hypothetical protein
MILGEMEVVEPEEIIEGAAAVVGNLLPSKSKMLYDMTYKNFKKWCMEKNVEVTAENVLLVFFGEKAKMFCWGSSSFDLLSGGSSCD